MTKHGESKTALYYRWKNIKQRCFNSKNPEWKNYGNRNITICNEWENDYTKFRDWALANGYKPELQIDRIDNNGNYEPNNCRWVNQSINQNNKRNNYFVTYMGTKKTITEWAKIVGIHRDTIDHRIQKGWSVKKTFETPKMKNQFG
jgi:hypothetical protein